MSDVNDDLTHIITAAHDYYQKPGNDVGGNLHIVLDDGNIEDYFIYWCMGRCVSDNDGDGFVLCMQLLSLHMVDRQRVYEAMYA